MIWLIVFLQLADIATTYYLIQHKGAVEANPLLNKAMKKIGFWPALLLFKGIFVALLLLVPLPFWGELLILAIYLFVVGSNSRLILKTK